jgi:hypothetical protein
MEQKIRKKQSLHLTLSNNELVTLLPYDEIEEAKNEETEIIKRHEEIQEIGKDVKIISELFQDLHHLVKLDDDKIYHLTENIIDSKNQVEKAEKELSAIGGTTTGGVPLAKSINTKKLILATTAISLVAGPVGAVVGIKAAIIVTTLLGLGYFTF